MYKKESIKKNFFLIQKYLIYKGSKAILKLFGHANSHTDGEAKFQRNHAKITTCLFLL